MSNSKATVKRVSKRPARQPAPSEYKVTIEDDGTLNTLTPLHWHCDVCGQPIGWNEGYITIDYPRRDPARTYTWEILHRTCDPHLDRYDYSVYVEACSTVEELLDWDRHLRHKTWINQTNWWMIRGTAERALDAVGATDVLARLRRGLP